MPAKHAKSQLSETSALAQNTIVTSQSQNYSWLVLRNIKSRTEYSRSKQYYCITILLCKTILRVNFGTQLIGLEQGCPTFLFNGLHCKLKYITGPQNHQNSSIQWKDYLDRNSQRF